MRENAEKARDGAREEKLVLECLPGADEDNFAVGGGWLHEPVLQAAGLEPNGAAAGCLQGMPGNGDCCGASEN